MMRPLIQTVVSPWLLSVAIVVIGAAPAGAQDRPARSSPATASPAARSWSGYRPGTNWVHSVPSQAVAGPAAVAAQTVAPGASRAVHANVYANRTGWAGYAPSSAWTGYRPGVAWRGYAPPGTRSINMRQAHVPGPSPYADGVARSYREYGTGRPVPLAKPWLPGSP